MQPIFTTKEALSYGWNKVMDHMSFFVLLTLGFFIAATIFDQIGGSRNSFNLFKLIGMLISYFAMFTFVRFGLRIYRGDIPKAKDIFKFDWKILGLYFFASLLYIVVTSAGFVLLIIPGIILSIRLSLYPFIIIDENLKPVPALKKSFTMTKNYFWPLLGLSIILSIINFLGLLLFGIGLLLTVPLCLFSMVYVYEKLKVPASSPAINSL